MFIAKASHSLEKIFTIHISDKELGSRIHFLKNSYKSIIRRHPIKRKE